MFYLLEGSQAVGFGASDALIAPPMLLPSYRVLGDDGTYVSARQICESTEIELDLLMRSLPTTSRRYWQNSSLTLKSVKQARHLDLMP